MCCQKTTGRNVDDDDDDVVDDDNDHGCEGKVCLPVRKQQVVTFLW